MKPLRILLAGSNFRPERIGIGKYSGEMATWLAARGHRVRVVTAPPYYPEWRVAQGYSACAYRRECLDGVEVFRCPVWVPSRLSGLRRLLHLASFSLSSLPVVLGQVFWRPDVVIVIEPPLMCAPSAWLAARLSGARAWLHIQDFEVDAAFDMGILPPGRLRRWVLVAERRLMRRFDRVSSISPRMCEKLRGKGLAPERVVLFPNWVDLEQIRPQPDDGRLRSELGIPADRFVALYSGNMGEKQGLEVVLEAARLAEGDSRLHFALCGDGASRERLQNNYAGLSNVSWHSLQPEERLNELLNLADVHLMPQRADVADLMLPSKLTGMLASGRPVLATAMAGTQVAEIVSRCGLVTRPGDAQALWAALVQLLESPDDCKAFSRAARAYAEEWLGQGAVLSRFEQELFSVRGMQQTLGEKR